MFSGSTLDVENYMKLYENYMKKFKRCIIGYDEVELLTMIGITLMALIFYCDFFELFKGLDEVIVVRL